MASGKRTGGPWAQPVAMVEKRIVHSALLAAASVKNPMQEALLQAIDVLRHSVADGPGCDDAAARNLAIADGEAALREAGLMGPAKPRPLTEGYGVKVRKTEVRCDDGVSTIDEWQVWTTNPKTGRPCIHRRFAFELEARAEAISLRALRKANGAKA